MDWFVAGLMEELPVSCNSLSFIGASLGFSAAAASMVEERRLIGVCLSSLLRDGGGPFVGITGNDGVLLSAGSLAEERR